MTALPARGRPGRGLRVVVVLAVGVGLGLVTACSWAPDDAVRVGAPGAPRTPAPPLDTAVVTVGAAGPVIAEIADDPAERRRGLMARDEVPVGTGMLFVYDEPVLTSFWMGNVEVPLSIAWVADDAVVGVAEMEPCPAADDTCPRYTPGVPFDRAVETTGETFTDAGVGVGDPVTVEGP